jgi:hypothetical protein
LLKKGVAAVPGGEWLLTAGTLGWAWIERRKKQAQQLQKSKYFDVATSTMHGVNRFKEKLGPKIDALKDGDGKIDTAAAAAAIWDELKDALAARHSRGGVAKEANEMVKAVNGAGPNGASGGA